VVLTRTAVAHMRAARDWWRRSRPDAPERFADELRLAFALLAEQPGIGVPVHDADFPGIRRHLIGRSRYHVYYRADSDERAIFAVAIWHASRGAAPDL